MRIYATRTGDRQAFEVNAKCKLAEQTNLNLRVWMVSFEHKTMEGFGIRCVKPLNLYVLSIEPPLGKRLSDGR